MHTLKVESPTMADAPSEPQPRRSIGAARNPDSEAAILAAAAAVLTEQGLGGFSIEAVARRAKAGKPTIYRWWPSKAHLLLDVYHKQKSDLIYPDTGALESDLEGFLVNLAAFWNEGPTGELFRSIIAEAQSNDDAAAALRDYADGRIAHSAMFVERAKVRGEVAADTDSRVAMGLISSYAWKLLLTGRLQASRKDLSEVARIVARGVLRR